MHRMNFSGKIQVWRSGKKYEKSKRSLIRTAAYGYLDRFVLMARAAQS